MMGELTTQTCGRLRGVKCECGKEGFVDRVGRRKRRGNEEPDTAQNPSRRVLLNHRPGAVTHCARFVRMRVGGLQDGGEKGEVAKMKMDVDEDEWS